MQEGEFLILIEAYKVVTKENKLYIIILQIL